MIQREPFIGKYHGVLPATEMALGGVSGGKNMRRISEGAGWKPRRGCAIHNTTAAEAGKEINSLHQYTNPRSNDYNFLAQINSKILEATNNPPAVGTTFGTALGVAVGTTPGFSATVGEYWFYADGSGRPLVWGGATPYPMACYVYDASEKALIAYAREAQDRRTDTTVIVLPAATDKFYILSEEPITGVVLDLGASVNSNDVDLQVKAWRAGAWTAVSSLTDGTDSTGCLAVDGTVSWAAGADEMTTLGRDLGYVYQFGWSGALSGNVTIREATVVQAAALMTNKWDGVFNWMTNCLFYDQSAGKYVELLGKVGTASTSLYGDISAATTSDFLYIKTPEPATGFGIGVVPEYDNGDAALIDQIDYWNGSAWTAITTGITDTTLDTAGDSSLSQTGRLFFDGAAITPKKRTFEGDNYEGFWYRISWAAALAADTRIYAIYYAALPEELPVTAGVVEFKSRLFLWGGSEYSNRLRFSSSISPFCFSGADSSYTNTFGDMRPIRRAIRFYNELAVFKKKGVFLLEGYSPSTFGILKLASTVGLASPQSLQVIEIGYKGMRTDEAMSILIWQDVDGVYACDGRKPQKVSGPVDNYFNPESSSCIAAADINDLGSFVDPVNNEYHLLLPDDIELVYNYLTNEWYPPWEREIELTCGLELKGTDGRYYTYGGSIDGFVMKLESDTSDKTTANADKAIEHSVKTRAIHTSIEGEPLFDFDLGRVWAQGKAQTAGTLVTKVHKDMATTGVAVTSPSVISMTNSGKKMFTDWVEADQERCNCVEIEFSCNTIDWEMELWSFTYELDAAGEDE